MMEDHTSTPSADDDQPNQRGRLQSSVQFPYSDLEAGIEVARALVNRGGSYAAPDEVAAAMGQAPTSGNFRLKVAAARVFGLVKTAPGRIELTDLGYEVLDPDLQRAARAQAFMSVELYSKVYTEFKGKTLPPRPAAFDRMLVRMGVSPKQADKARQALDRSAQQAGFFEYGKEKLVFPPGIGGEEGTDRNPPGEGGNGSGDSGGRRFAGGGGSGGGGGGRDLDPLLLGLLDRLPKPDEGWPIRDRVRWLQALALNLSLIYGDDGGDVEIRTRSDKDSP